MTRDSQEGASTHRQEPLPAHVDHLPVLPVEYAAALDHGLAVLGLPLAPEIRAAIDDHVRLLLAWNQAVNLTAIRDPVGVARGHVLDSLAALPLVRALGAGRLLDLGSGGGYPGLPLAVATPLEALLVDSVGKKARFLHTVTAALGVADRVRVTSFRAEALAADPAHRGRWPLVTARAVAGLDELVELAWPLLTAGGHLVAWKRSPLDDELVAAGRAITALEGGLVEAGRVAVHGIPAGIPGLEEHVLVVATKLHPTPAGFPRDPAHRKRHPW